MTDRTALLSMHGISKSFGATCAWPMFRCRCARGEVLALIGENGAGKSTLMKVLSGAHRPDAGEMYLDGRVYAPSGPHQARQAGVAMIYQELNLAPDLSVEDNIMLGQEVHRSGWLRRGPQRSRVSAGARHARPSRTAPRNAGPTSSPSARGNWSRSPAPWFLSPRSSSSTSRPARLRPTMSSICFRSSPSCAKSGLGIIYISHFLEEIRRVAQRYTVLRDGHTVGGGLLAGASEADIVALMVGRNVKDLFPTVPHTPAKPILSLEGVSGAEDAARRHASTCGAAKSWASPGWSVPGGRNCCAASSGSTRARGTVRVAALHAARQSPRSHQGRPGTGFRRSQRGRSRAGTLDRRQPDAQPAALRTAAGDGSTCIAARRPCGTG